MKLKSIQASAFKSLFEVLKEIINDVNVYFDSSGMHLSSFDVARVTLVNVVMPCENFEEYECKTPVTIGLNVANTYKLIKSTGTNDVIHLENTVEHLKITISNEVKKSKSTFNLKLLDLNEELVDIPELSHIKYITTVMPSFDFQKLIRDMSAIGTDILIKRYDTCVEFTCDGDFANQTTIVNEQSKSDIICGGVFSIKYISMFVKSTVLCPIVQIYQNDNEDSPVIFKYSIANLGHIKFYLAAVNE
jgi:proliferating cell nuclear antigen